MAIRVRVVITLLCVALIVVSAAVTLGVTYTFSLDAAQKIAESHAVALASKAKGDVEAFVNIPVGRIAGLQYMLQRDTFPLPNVTEAAGDANWFRRWWQILVSDMRSADFAYQFAVYGFNDGNYAGCKLLPPDANTIAGLFECRVFKWSARTGTPGLSSVYQEDYFISNYSLYRNASLTTTYDPRTRSWWTATPHVAHTMTWSSVYLSAMPTLPIVDINAAMFNASGAFLGIGSFTFELGQLSTFITGLETTPNTNVFLIDNDNVLMASTYDAVPYLKETEVPSNYSASNVPAGCVMSDVANGAARSLILCRYSLTTYPYAPLLQLEATAGSDVVRNGTGGRALRMKLDGTNFYVTIAPISTPLALGMQWRVVLLMPENDIIQGIIDGRNTAIYIACGLLGATSLLALLMVSAILSPLASLAEHMYRAASFDDSVVAAAEGGEDEEATKAAANANKNSAFTEVRTIQEAFDTLMGELSKVKSYLPQSVLAALYGGDDEDEGEMVESIADDADAADRRISTLSADPMKRDKSGSVAPSTTPAVTRGSSNLHAAPSQILQRGASTMSTMGKRRSMMSSMVGGAGGKDAMAAVPALNTMLKLTQKKVTVLVINILRFHELVKLATPEELLKVHGAIVDVVSRVAKENKGVIDSFSGDRFTITFNAVTNVGNHACAAANCALGIIKAVNEARLEKMNSAKAAAAGVSSKGAGGPLGNVSGVTGGIATSAALVGNTGTTAMKRFCVFGPCVSHAILLERLCKQYVVPQQSGLSSPSIGCQSSLIMMSGQAILDAENFYELMSATMLMLPGLSMPSEAKRTRVSILAGPKSVACDEWMYQLEEGNNSSCYGLYNDAFHRLLEVGGLEREKAVELATAAARRECTEAEDSQLFDVYRQVSHRLLHLAQAVPSGQKLPENYVDSMSSFFTTCMAGGIVAKMESGKG